MILWPRWGIGLAAAIAAAALVAVARWAAFVWTNTALGSLAAGLMALPIALTLLVIASRQPQWPPKGAPHGARGALVSFCAVEAATAACLLWAGPESRWLMLLAGVLAISGALTVVWGAQGQGRARALAIPALAAVFALPWEWALRPLDPILQRWSAVAAAWILDLAGYEGKVWDTFGVYTPKYWVVVNETCSGVNMLITLSFFGLIYGWASQPRILGRLALLAIIPALALGANALRVAVICLLGHYGGDELAMGGWHYGSAYIVFLPMFVVVYGIGRMLR